MYFCIKIHLLYLSRLFSIKCLWFFYTLHTGWFLPSYSAPAPSAYFECFARRCFLCCTFVTQNHFDIPFFSCECVFETERGCEGCKLKINFSISMSCTGRFTKLNRFFGRTKQTSVIYDDKILKENRPSWQISKKKWHESLGFLTTTEEKHKLHHI